MYSSDCSLFSYLAMNPQVSIVEFTQLWISSELLILGAFTPTLPISQNAKDNAYLGKKWNNSKMDKKPNAIHQNFSFCKQNKNSGSQIALVSKLWTKMSSPNCNVQLINFAFHLTICNNQQCIGTHYMTRHP